MGKDGLIGNFTESGGISRRGIMKPLPAMSAANALCINVNTWNKQGEEG